MPKGRCTPAKHRAAAAHRKAQASYVSRHPDRHKAAVKRYQAKNKGKINAAKRAARAAGTAERSHTKGRPREC